MTTEMNDGSTQLTPFVRAHVLAEALRSGAYAARIDDRAAVMQALMAYRDRERKRSAETVFYSAIAAYVDALAKNCGVRTRSNRPLRRSAMIRSPVLVTIAVP